MQACVCILGRIIMSQISGYIRAGTSLEGEKHGFVC